MNTILYIRQSKGTDNPEDSLAGQERECRIYAEKHGLEITQVLRDDVTGQTELALRKNGGKLLLAIQERECAAILLPSVDRFSRDTFDASDDLKKIIKYLGDSGIKWYFADRDAPFDYTSEAQQIDVLSELVASAKERVNIKKRTMRKKHAMLSDGQLMLTGKPPFGYYEDKHIDGNKVIRDWIIEPAQAVIVKQIFELYTSGTQVKELAQVLNSEDALSPGDRDWNTTALYRILNHEIYKGLFVWGKYKYNKKDKSKVLRKPDDKERFEIDREDFRIVSNEVWARAQVIAKDNKAIRPKAKEYLLRGHLVCECGEHYIGNGNYYRCKSTKVKGKSCGNGGIRKDVIENEVWSLVTDTIHNPRDLHARLWDTLEHGSKAQIELLAQSEDISKSIAQKNRQIDSVALSISRASGDRMIGALLKQGQTLERELLTLEQEHGDIILGLQTDVIDNDELNEIVQVKVLDWTEDLDTADYNRKRVILSDLSARVLMYSQETAEKRGHDWGLLVSIGNVS